ncbi:hypothetical protein LZ009_08375 [Ramlibacter sp. XY19]|uniref:hypothetical protein n=1 Tax=Ramlibacter paludis TaxID=2908000 RepID=UPI0023DCDF64|nr:hypothetical protein [Ramlibacter paludis]MCG2592798.1 hypothetical protein [Ramlibacter paludis]
MSAFSPSAAMPLQGLTLPPPAARPAARPRARAAARPRQAARARQRATPSARLAWCGLLLVLALEVALLFFPQALRLHPVQGTGLFKQLTGYTMCALLAFALALGWLRRLPGMERRARALTALHQASGPVLLLLLGSHAGQAPGGFLLCVFHGMALAVAAGALRTVLGTRAARKASVALLAVHISVSCMVAAGAVLHLYFVYVYAA